MSCPEDAGDHVDELGLDGAEFDRIRRIWELEETERRPAREFEVAQRSAERIRMAIVHAKRKRLSLQGWDELYAIVRDTTHDRVIRNLQAAGILTVDALCSPELSPTTRCTWATRSWRCSTPASTGAPARSRVPPSLRRASSARSPTQYHRETPAVTGPTHALSKAAT